VQVKNDGLRDPNEPLYRDELLPFETMTTPSVGVRMAPSNSSQKKRVYASHECSRNAHTRPFGHPSHVKIDHHHIQNMMQAIIP
jgi:hypothetical protein